MNKEEYRKLLQDPRWKDKREEILERDGHKCIKCGSKNKLQVHHLCYKDDRAPWEYDNDELITVCIGCHETIRELSKKKLYTRVPFLY